MSSAVAAQRTAATVNSSVSKRATPSAAALKTVRRAEPFLRRCGLLPDPATTSNVLAQWSRDALEERALSLTEFLWAYIEVFASLGDAAPSETSPSSNGGHRGSDSVLESQSDSPSNSGRGDASGSPKLSARPLNSGWANEQGVLTVGSRSPVKAHPPAAAAPNSAEVSGLHLGLNGSRNSSLIPTNSLTVDSRAASPIDAAESTASHRDLNPVAASQRSTGAFSAFGDLVADSTVMPGQLSAVSSFAPSPREKGRPHPPPTIPHPPTHSPPGNSTATASMYVRRQRPTLAGTRNFSGDAGDGVLDYGLPSDNLCTDSMSMSQIVAFSHAKHQADDIVGNEIINEYLVLDVLGNGVQGEVFVVYNLTTQVQRAMKRIARPRFANVAASLLPSPGESLSTVVSPLARGKLLQQQRHGVAVSSPNAGGLKTVSSGSHTSSSSSSFAHGAPSSFVTEVAIMKKLRHRNIIRLHEVIDDPAHHFVYLVMDFVAGGPIGKNQNRSAVTCDRVLPATLAGYVAQILDGLGYLQRHHISHRDIKPDNILVDEDGVVKLIDFGVAQLTADTEGGDGGVRGRVGTPAFMAPELMYANSAAAVHGLSSDTWALGTTVFLLLAGRAPYTMTPQDPSWGPTFPDEIPMEWHAFIRATLAMAPHARPSLQVLRRLLPTYGRNGLVALDSSLTEPAWRDGSVRGAGPVEGSGEANLGVGGRSRLHGELAKRPSERDLRFALTPVVRSGRSLLPGRRPSFAAVMVVKAAQREVSSPDVALSAVPSMTAASSAPGFPEVSNKEVVVVTAPQAATPSEPSVQASLSGSIHNASQTLGRGDSDTDEKVPQTVVAQSLPGRE